MKTLFKLLQVNLIEEIRRQCEETKQTATAKPTPAWRCIGSGELRSVVAEANFGAVPITPAPPPPTANSTPFTTSASSILEVVLGNNNRLEELQ